MALKTVTITISDDKWTFYKKDKNINTWLDERNLMVEIQNYLNENHVNYEMK